MAAGFIPRLLPEPRARLAPRAAAGVLVASVVLLALPVAAALVAGAAAAGELGAWVEVPVVAVSAEEAAVAVAPAAAEELAAGNKLKGTRPCGPCLSAKAPAILALTSGPLRVSGHHSGGQPAALRMGIRNQGLIVLLVLSREPSTPIKGSAAESIILRRFCVCRLLELVAEDQGLQGGVGPIEQKDGIHGVGGYFYIKCYNGFGESGQVKGAVQRFDVHGMGHGR